MRKACLFVLGVLLASSAMAQPPVQSVRQLTQGNVESFRAWSKTAPRSQRSTFMREIRGLERREKKRVLRLLVPELRTGEISRSGSTARLGGPFSLQYDNFPGAPLTFSGGFLNGYMGNQFDASLPSGTNSINTVQFLGMAFGQFPVNAQLGFFGPIGPVSGNTAPPLGTRMGPVINGSLQTVVLSSPITGLTGSFQAGLFQPAYVPPAEGLGLAYLAITGYAYTNVQGGVAGPGDSLHLMFATPGGSHNAIASSGLRNGVFRVSGVTIPVELTNFSVE